MNPHKKRALNQKEEEKLEELRKRQEEVAAEIYLQFFEDTRKLEELREKLDNVKN